MNKKLLLSILSIAFAPAAFAADTTANFQTTATINATCTISATNLDFGSVSPAATGEAFGTGIISSVCTKGTEFAIAINPGANGTYANRQMAGVDTVNNTDRLSYNLYTSNVYDRIWGNGSNGTSHIIGEATGAQRDFTFYGKLPLNQYVKPDSYRDNLTVTLNY